MKIEYILLKIGEPNLFACLGILEEDLDVM